MLFLTLLQCTVLHYPAMHNKVLVSLSQQMHFYSQVSTVTVSVKEVHYIVVQYYEIWTSALHFSTV